MTWNFSFDRTLKIDAGAIETHANSERELFQKLSELLPLLDGSGDAIVLEWDELGGPEKPSKPAKPKRKQPA